MIISHEHKFIFIKTAKTGGSTIENILGQHLGPKDIASGSAYIDSEDVRPTSKRNWPKINYPDELGGYSHLPVSLIYDKFFDGQKPKDYFVFTIERNSYEKAVSHWWWHTHSKRLTKTMQPTNVAFRDHLVRHIREPWNNHPSCWHRYNNNKNICVDHIYQYDQWEEMFKDLSTRLNISIDMDSTRNIKLKDSKKPFNHYREAYGDHEQELVEQLFIQEIKHFGYRF